MDRMTTAICEKPYGRASFARVLVEIDSNKALVDNVELWYESLGKILKIWVEYTWVPPRCEECKVYGHYLSECAKKVNIVSKVNKNGENEKVADVVKVNNSGEAKKVSDEEGWQTAVNRRNYRGAVNNNRQNPIGGYNMRRGVNSSRGGFNNRGGSSAGNSSTRDANKKYEPVNNGSVGNVDDGVVANDSGKPVNKGKNAVNENGGSASGKSKNTNSTAINNSGNMNDKVANVVNKSDKGSKNGNGVSDKEVLGTKNVAVSNRFDLLREDNEHGESDTWKEVKDLVVIACSTGVPIAEKVLKHWTADMVKFYTVKWNNRPRSNDSVKLQFENEIKSLSHQIVQINRNLDKNSKLNAEKMLKIAGLTTQADSGISFIYYIWQERNIRIFQNDFRTEETVFKIIVDTVRYKLMGLNIKYSREVVKIAAIWKLHLKVLEVRRLCTTGTDPNFCAGSLYWIMKCICVLWVCWFCLGTGFWSCNKVFDRGDVGGYNRLCTTENWTSFYAGLLFGSLEYNMLCTTEPSPNLCAGCFVLIWIMRRLLLQVCSLLHMLFLYSFSLCKFFPPGFYLPRFFNEIGYIWVMLIFDESPILMNAVVGVRIITAVKLLKFCLGSSLPQFGCIVYDLSVSSLSWFKSNAVSLNLLKIFAACGSETGCCLYSWQKDLLMVWSCLELHWLVPLESSMYSEYSYGLRSSCFYAKMTTAICEKPYGRASFARVLVEIDSSKALVDNVELWYESLGKILKLWVEYTWVPPRCDECKVYGHYLSECAKKVNTVSKVNKDGENVRNIGKDKDNSTCVANNGDGEEGWQTATNRRNNRGIGYNTRQGPSGGYNGNQYTGNAGTRNVSQKPEPVNNGNVGKVDESVVMNENGQNINKGKSKVNENGTSNTGKSNNGSVDSKKSMANNNYGNKNEKEAAKVNKSDKSKKSGNEVSTKDVSGAKNVATSNHFDLLRDDNVCEEVDPWKEVKELVVAACNTGVPIYEVVLKNWNEDMIKFYSVKWNNRSKKSGYIKQQLESEMVSLVNQIVQLNRNLNRNSKLNAEKMLKNSVLTTKDASEAEERVLSVIVDIVRHSDGIISSLDFLADVYGSILNHDGKGVRIASCAESSYCSCGGFGVVTGFCRGDWVVTSAMHYREFLVEKKPLAFFGAGLLFRLFGVQHAMHYRTESRISAGWAVCFNLDYEEITLGRMSLLMLLVQFLLLKLCVWVFRGKFRRSEELEFCIHDMSVAQLVVELSSDDGLVFADSIMYFKTIRDFEAEKLANIQLFLQASPAHLSRRMQFLARFNAI
ncbi:hypothetical protein CTI12_AA401330 [Artemisia annua]|uniref:Uncharacterized protein n=1 Tax=Artemisia annua TaxID=35608 RepID=A0A2U1MA21_ARTAN|nr:hypothetical protein CTI12_AA401330 [Artemisia annua]